MIPLLAGCTSTPVLVAPASSPTPIVAALEGDTVPSDPELRYAPAREVDVPIIVGAGPAGLAAATWDAAWTAASAAPSAT